MWFLADFQIQANASNIPGTNTSWNYYFADYRSENDAYGMQHVLYYNPRGKAMFQIQDLAGLNRVTANLYDGQDRAIFGTLPEGNKLTITYDATTSQSATSPPRATRAATRLR